MGVQHFEQFSELILLAVVPILDKDHGGSAIVFSEVDQVEEGALVELVDGHVS